MENTLTDSSSLEADRSSKAENVQGAKEGPEAVQGNTAKGTESEGKDGRKDDWPVKGSPGPTLVNSRGITVPAIPGRNGGLLAPANRLGDTNPNAGRTPDRLRRKATDALEGQIEEIGSLLTQVVTRAKLELEGSGNVHTGLAALNQVAKLAATLTSIGPGTKVTNVVERPEWVQATRECMEESGVPAELVTQVLKLMDARLA